MKRMYWLALVAAMMITGDAMAAAEKAHAAPKTRAEAISMMKEKLASLEKMSDDEWAAQKKKRTHRGGQGKGAKKATAKKKAN